MPSCHVVKALFRQRDETGANTGSKQLRGHFTDTDGKRLRRST